MEYTPRMTENKLVAHAAALGSMVLLKNTGSTLPLVPAGSEKLPVAVFGTGQLETACCCAEFPAYRKVSVLDGLCASEGIAPDSLLVRKYRTHELTEPGKRFAWETLSMEELAEENAAAIVVVTRKEEAYDPILDTDEQAMIRAVGAHFSRLILVLNTPGYMEIAPVADLCGAIVFMGIAGQEGGAALAELLTGSAMFRGKLNQSWPRRRADFTLANQKKDIYSGYRYFDTFNIDLLYDFGHGLTYGAAELEQVSVAVDNTDLLVTASVVNTGAVWPVSQVVQIYVSRPEEGLPQPKYTFQAFARTRMLDPGESQTLTLSIPLSDLASFSEDASAFVLRAGYYDIRIGFSARSAMIAASLSVKRDEIVQPVLPMKLPRTAVRSAPQPCFYPGEEEERQAARKNAIRVSGWNIPRRSLRRSRKPAACRPAAEPVRLEDVKHKTAGLQEFVGSMDDRSLRALVMEFGFCDPLIPGALGSSADLREAYGIPPMTVAAGADGLLLTKDLTDEDGAVIAHQFCTAFPAASLLGCCWDTELVSAVAAAVGREMKEYHVDLWLAPGADLIRSPSQRHVSRCWSEDPIMAGIYTRALCQGVGKYGGSVLRSVSMEHKSPVTQRTFRELSSLSFSIAASAAQAVLLPTQWPGDEPAGEDTEMSRMLVHQWGFSGMFLADDERFTREPDRLQLEQSALKILRFILTRI